MRGAIRVGLLALVAAGTGCQTPVGNYFVNRARDLGECFRVQVGAGVGIGAGVRALGVIDVGLGYANWNRSFTVGAVYGELYPCDVRRRETWNCEVAFFAISMSAERATELMLGSEFEGEARFRVYRAMVLPALLTARTVVDEPEYELGGAGADSTRGRNKQIPGRLAWLWSDPPPFPHDWAGPPAMWTRARIHAFDVEAYAFCGLVGAEVGFSPGEFLDFLLGWFGADIAGDDRPFSAPAKE